MVIFSSTKSLSPLLPSVLLLAIFSAGHGVQVKGHGVLYVSHSHNTYAKSSMGTNAYIIAVDLVTGKILWRSAPLVANASNFTSAPTLPIINSGCSEIRSDPAVTKIRPLR